MLEASILMRPYKAGVRSPAPWAMSCFLHHLGPQEPENVVLPSPASQPWSPTLLPTGPGLVCVTKRRATATAAAVAEGSVSGAAVTDRSPVTSSLEKIPEDQRIKQAYLYFTWA